MPYPDLKTFGFHRRKNGASGGTPRLVANALQTVLRLRDDLLDHVHSIVSLQAFAHHIKNFIKEAAHA